VADEDLEALARLSASTRQLVITLLLAIVLCVGAGWFLASVVQANEKVIAAGVLGALVASMAIAMKVPTPPHRFPTIRALRDRAAEVAYVVSIFQHKHIVALADHGGHLLAKPLVLKGTAAMPSIRNADAVVQAQRSQKSQALQIISRRCPSARNAEIRDVLGIASTKKLVNKAIAALPPA